MPQAPRDQFAVLGPWRRGLNNTVPRHLLEPDQLFRASDVDIGPAGEVRARQPARGFLTLPDGLRPLYVAPSPGQWRHLTQDAGLLVAYAEGDDLKVAYVAEPTSPTEAADINDLSPVQFGRSLTDHANHAPMPSQAVIGDVMYLCYAGEVIRLAGPGIGGASGSLVKLTRVTHADWSEDYEMPMHNIQSATPGTWPFSACIGSFQNGGSEWALSGFFDTIRWSHPLSPEYTHGPEDWSESDYIRIESDPVDQTLGFVQYRDSILILKSHSIWHAFGREPAQWRVLPITKNFGVPHAGCAVVTPQGVVLTDGERVLIWDGGALRDLFAGRYEVDVGSLVGDRFRRAQATSVGYYDGLLYVSLPLRHVTHREVSRDGGFGRGFGSGFSRHVVNLEGPLTTVVMDLSTGAVVEHNFGASCWFSMKHPALQADGFPDHGLLFCPAYAPAWDTLAFADDPPVAARIPPRQAGRQAQAVSALSDLFGPAALRPYTPYIGTGGPPFGGSPDALVRWRNSLLRVETAASGGTLAWAQNVSGLPARHGSEILPAAAGALHDVQMGAVGEGTSITLDVTLPPNVALEYAAMKYWPDRRRL